MYIVGLYEARDIYQVCAENDDVLYQGSKVECMLYKEIKEE